MKAWGFVFAAVCGLVMTAAGAAPLAKSNSHPGGETPEFTEDFGARTAPDEQDAPGWHWVSGRWSQRQGHASVVFDNKLWVIGGWDGTYRNEVWWSEDGVSWTLVTANAGWSARAGHTSVVFDNKLWVLGGGDRNDVWWSEDGVTWTEATASAGWSPRGEHTSVVFDNKLWVFGGRYRNDVWWSEDGVTWTQATANADWTGRLGHTTVVFANKLWVLGGFGFDDGLFHYNDVWWSGDGVSWTQATANADWIGRYGHTSVVFDNKLWVLGGSSSGRLNDVWCSGDGVTWSEVTADPGWAARLDHTSVVFDNKLWVLGGNSFSTVRRNDVWCSEDGVTWTESANADWSARSRHTSVVFDNKLWVLGGYGNTYRNDVWWSEDGVGWTEVTEDAGWSARSGHTSVVFDNKLWVLGGYGGSYCNDVWRSEDGVTWTEATAHAGWSARWGHTSVIFDNKLWVLGGYNSSGGRRNDMWWSSDGVTWTQATTDAGWSWSARSGHTSVVFDNKLWILGGYNSSSDRINDVWWSEDGVRWTRATANAGWAARSSHTSVVFDSKLWVLGGYGSGYLNDVWWSEDGVSWTLVTANAEWAARYGHTTVASDGALWLFGGHDGNPRDDVWRSSNPSSGEGEGEGEGEIICESSSWVNDYPWVPECEQASDKHAGCLCSMLGSYGDYTHIVPGTFKWRLESVRDMLPTPQFADMDYAGTANVYSYTNGAYRNEGWEMVLGICLDYNVPNVQQVELVHNNYRVLFERCGNTFVHWEEVYWECGQSVGYCMFFSSELRILVSTGDGVVFDVPLADSVPDCSNVGGCEWEGWEGWEWEGSEGQEPEGALPHEGEEPEGALPHEGEEPEGALPHEGEEPAIYHTADSNKDNRFSLSELLRLIQLFNSGGFRCATAPDATEDGFLPGSGDAKDCRPHDSDYEGGAPDWRLSMNELLRAIQFFNSGNYHHCPDQGTEDGYCPGLEVTIFAQ